MCASGGTTAVCLTGLSVTAAWVWHFRYEIQRLQQEAQKDDLERQVNWRMCTCHACGVKQGCFGRP
jgi:hypothetical protein